jgi:hypothetical protein
MPARLPLVPLLATTLAAACGGDATGGGVERLDSAGVPVVVNAAPDSSSPVWRLSAQPVVEIGAVDGPEAYQLFRASSGAVLSDGTIVVANGGTQQVRFYDSAGRHLRSVGGQGEGPGQFRTLSLLGSFAGDSLLVWDMQARRLSVFGPDGTFARSYGGPAELGLQPVTGGVLADGRMVARQRLIGPGSGDEPLQRHPDHVIAVTPAGAAADTLGAFPGVEMSMFDAFWIGVIFGRGLHVHARGDRIAVGNDDGYSVRVYGADGSLLRIVRQAHPPVPVGSGDFDTAAPPLDRPGPIQARLAGAVAQMPRHPTFPAYQAIRVDVAGRLWVQDFVRPGVEGSTWRIFDADGVYLATLDVPPGIDLLDLGEDHVLARARDEMEVERVRLHRLEFAGAGG